MSPVPAATPEAGGMELRQRSSSHKQSAGGRPQQASRPAPLADDASSCSEASHAPHEHPARHRPPANQFRSNIEFTEKPRQLLVLGALMSAMVYLGYSHQGGDRIANTRAAFAAVCFTFLTHCFLQCRDTVIIRPHPGVWRVVHGIGMIYLMCMAILLVQDRHHARELVGVFFEDIGPVPPRKTGNEPFQDCSLNLSTLKRQVTEIWFLAHVLGWWGKMVMFRDWGVCWMLSVAFEMLECSLQFIIPEFKECWWDSLLIDLLGANLLGMVAGWWTLRMVETNVYDWSGSSEPKRGRIRRFVNSLSPYSFTRYRWSVFSSFKRFLQVMALVAICLTMELNAFMLLHTLQVPKASAFNKVRLTLVALLAMPSAAEYYDFIANPEANRLGQNAWCMIAIMQLEIVVWLKFWPSSLVLSSPPADVHVPWAITLTLLGMWMFLSLTLVKDDDLGSRTITTPRSAHQRGSSSSFGSSSQAGHEVMSSPEKAPGGGRQARTRKEVTVGLVQELIDMVFFLAFLPLVWLVKQWAF